MVEAINLVENLKVEKKHLIINSTEINKQLYKVTREAAFNDFYSVY